MGAGRGHDAGHGAAPPLRVTLLGGFHVAIGGEPVPDAAWRLQKARGLLKLLALAPGQRLTRDQLLDQLWPTFPPEGAVANLYSTLTVVRHVLAPIATLRLRGGTLTLETAGPLTIDAADFSAAAATARRSGEPADHEAALALYTGELLPEDRYEDWAAAPREALRALFHGLLLALAAAYEGRGAGAAAIDTLQRLFADDPIHEAAHVALMRLYALNGQQGAAIRQYRQLQGALETALDAEPGDAARALYGAIMAGRFPTPGGATSGAAEVLHTLGGRGEAPSHNLPVSLTSFIGREREVGELKALLECRTRSGESRRGGRTGGMWSEGEPRASPAPDTVVPRPAGAPATTRFPAPRLVTLSGAGGCGKTRLALTVARALVEEYPDGVWLVELAALRDPAVVVGAVAAAVGVREVPGESLLTTLAAALRPRRTLLVLDNCEHLAGAVAEILDALLAAGAGVRVLATSRAVLGVPGEITWRVPPLALPEPWPPGGGEAALAAVAATASARCFVARVRQRQPDFALTEAHAPAIVAICRRLAGLPLALELAAGRAAVLTVEQVAARLDRALQTLVTQDRGVAGRQQTLRATLDWSYDLLDAGDQRLFRRLSVFAGGWTLAAAAALGAGSDAVGGLERLVAQSLVQVEYRGPEARYALLEPVRQYAAERLVARGEATPARARHALVYLRFVAGAARGLLGREQAAWLDRLTVERDNLRGALTWFADRGDAARGLRLCGKIWWFWRIQSQHTEARRWLARFLDLGAAAIPPALRLRALFAAGYLASDQEDLAPAAALAERALALAREGRQQATVADCLGLLGHLAHRQGEVTLARARFTESIALNRAVGHRFGLAHTLIGLGGLDLDLGDTTSARALLGESLAIFEAAGDRAQGARVCFALGLAALAQGEVASSGEWFAEALARCRAVGHRLGLWPALVYLGDLAAHAGNGARARALLREALALAGEERLPPARAAALEGWAILATLEGRPARALRLAGAAQALREGGGFARFPSDRDRYAAILAAARAALAPDEAEAAWQVGGLLAPEAASTEALALG